MGSSGPQGETRKIHSLQFAVRLTVVGPSKRPGSTVNGMLTATPENRARQGSGWKEHEHGMGWEGKGRDVQDSIQSYL